MAPFRTGLVAGALCGLAAPFTGLFVGLQVSPAPGTVLAAPFVALAVLTGTPLGMMSPALLLAGLGLSVLAGAALGALVQYLWRSLT